MERIREFKLGYNTYRARLGISAPSDTADAFTASYNLTPFSDTTTMAGSPSPLLNNVSQVKYWTCDRVTGSSNVTVQVFWENAPYSGIDSFTSDLVVARWNGSAWENAGQSAIEATDPGSITSDLVTSFSPFTFCSLSSSMNILPIELLSFDAIPVKNEVVLNWETATEINNDYFEVQRSVNGSDWEAVSRIKGAGNSLSNRSYVTYDYNPLPGISYYRLKQTDFDEKFTFSPI